MRASLRGHAARALVAATLAACGAPAAVTPPPVIESPARAVPVVDACDAWPLGPKCVRALAAGGGWTCALTEQRAFCWGKEAAEKAKGAPVLAVPLAEVDALGVRRTTNAASSKGISCALDAAMVASCQGERAGTTLHTDKRKGTDRILPHPTFVARQVALGDEHACIRGDDGSIYCLGDNDAGQLGDGTTETTWDGKPRRVAGIPPAVDLALGPKHGCALTAEGEVVCWGDAGGFPPGAEPPFARARLVQWAIDSPGTGGEQTCVSTDDGRMLCAAYGRHVFQQVGGLDRVDEIAPSGDGTCARMGTRVSCARRAGPAEPMADLAPARALVAGTTCVVLESGDIRCRGEYDSEIGKERDPITLPGLGPVRGAGIAERAVDGEAACAITARGDLRCWGHVGWDWSYDNEPPGHPSLWLPSWVPRDVRTWNPVALAGPKDVVELSARGACARTRDGKVYVLAQLGRAPGRKYRLAAVTLPEAARAVRLIGGNVCAAERADGSVFRLEQPQIPAMGPVPSPPAQLTELPDLGGAVQIEVGSGIACARFQDGTARCIPGSRDEARPLAVKGQRSFALTPAPVRDLFIGLRHMPCVLPEQGGLFCRSMDARTSGALVEPLRWGSATPVRAIPDHR
jgi:hypothetical protein